MTYFEKVILHGGLYILEKISNTYGYKRYKYIDKLNSYISQIKFYGYDLYYDQDFESQSNNIYYVKLSYKNEVKYDSIVNITASYLESLLTK